MLRSSPRVSHHRAAERHEEERDDDDPQQADAAWTGIRMGDGEHLSHDDGGDGEAERADGNLRMSTHDAIIIRGT